MSIPTYSTQLAWFYKWRVFSFLVGLVALAILPASVTAEGEEKAPPKPKPIFFSDYPEFGSKEERDLINGTIANLERRLLYKGRVAQDDCINAYLAKEENFKDLFGRIRYWAKTEKETPEIKYPKPVAWYIVVRLLTLCPGEEQEAKK